MRPRFEMQPHRAGDAGSLLFMAIGLLFWVAVIFGLVMLISWYVKRQNIGHSNVEDPVDIAKVRYAKGEITKDKFEQLKKDLK